MYSTSELTGLGLASWCAATWAKPGRLVVISESRTSTFFVPAGVCTFRESKTEKDSFPFQLPSATKPSELDTVAREQHTWPKGALIIHRLTTRCQRCVSPQWPHCHQWKEIQLIMTVAVLTHFLPLTNVSDNSRHTASFLPAPETLQPELEKNYGSPSVCVRLRLMQVSTGTDGGTYFFLWVVSRGIGTACRRMTCSCIVQLFYFSLVSCFKQTVKTPGRVAAVKC